MFIFSEVVGEVTNSSERPLSGIELHFISVMLWDTHRILESCVYHVLDDYQEVLSESVVVPIKTVVVLHAEHYVVLLVNSHNEVDND